MNGKIIVASFTPFFFLLPVLIIYLYVDVALWEIVSEILSMTANCGNPFELDFLFIDNLPLEEAVLLTGSLLEFLETVWVQADSSITFSDKSKSFFLFYFFYRVTYKNMRSVSRYSNSAIKTCR